MVTIPSKMYATNQIFIHLKYRNRKPDVSKNIRNAVFFLPTIFVTLLSYIMIVLQHNKNM